MNAEPGLRQSLESLRGDGGTAAFAQSVPPGIKTFERSIDLSELHPSGLQQAGHLLALEGDGVALRVVLIVGGDVLAGRHEVGEGSFQLPHTTRRLGAVACEPASSPIVNHPAEVYPTRAAPETRRRLHAHPLRQAFGQNLGMCPMRQAEKPAMVIGIATHDLKGITMTETLAIARQRIVTPLATTVIALALIAALALGFGIRAWTEGSPMAATSSPGVHLSPIPSSDQPADSGRRISGAS